MPDLLHWNYLYCIINWVFCFYLSTYTVYSIYLLSKHIPTTFVFVCLHVQYVNNMPTFTLGVLQSWRVCQGTAMLWAAHLCESLSLRAIDRPLGPASTQGPICSTECVILSQQACHSSNHSNTHSFLEFWILRPLRTIKTRGFVWFWSGLVSLIHRHWSYCCSRRH